MCSSSRNTTTNLTENTSNQMANYGDGFQIIAGEGAGVNVVVTDGGAVNSALQFADNVTKDLFNYAAETNRNTAQIADNAMRDAAIATRQAQASAAASSAASAATAQRSIEGAYQFADNAMADNSMLLDKAIVSNNLIVNDSIGFVEGVVSASAEQSKDLADSVMNLAETVKTGTSAASKNMKTAAIVGVMGLATIYIFKKVA